MQLLGGMTVLDMGQFSKCWSTTGMHSGWHFLYVSLYFMWLSTLTEHWNKFYLCLQAGFNYLQNNSQTTTWSSLVSWTCLACTYLVDVSASHHTGFSVSCLQEWPSTAKLNQVWIKLRSLFPPVLNTGPFLMSVFSVKLLLQKGIFLYFFVLCRHKFDLLVKTITAKLEDSG